MDRRHGERLLDGPGPALALALAGPWQAAVAVRNACYDRGLARVRRLPVPVVSVGNLVLGGSGKTPLVAWLVDLLRARGRRPAVLSRGYRGGGKANDEARLLSAPVYCDPDRYAGGCLAVAEGADCLVLDDGFQHRRLHRDADLLCLDASRPWGRSDGRLGALFPLGRLRESPRALARAEAVVLTRCDQVSAGRLARLQAQVAGRVSTVVVGRHAPSRLVDLAGADGGPPSGLAGRRVRAVSAIGHPAAFERTLADCGAVVVGRDRFPDHHGYGRRELQAILTHARREGSLVVTTAKDAVKWRELLPVTAPVRVLEVQLALDGDGLEAVIDGALARSLR